MQTVGLGPSKADAWLRKTHMVNQGLVTNAMENEALDARSKASCRPAALD